jgi:hypothetical protein
MVSSREYQDYLASRLGSDLFISEPERATRIADAAEEGCDGSYHSEHIEDQRQYLKSLKVFDPDYDDIDDATFDITMAVYDAISKELDDIEEDHIKDGTIDQAP